MRLRIHDLKNWTELKSGQPLSYPGNDARTVELHFNCEKETVLRVAHGLEGEQKMSLAGVLKPGRTEVVVPLEGEVHFFAITEGEVWFYDPVGRNKRQLRPEAVSFTGPMNRIARDPEMERYWRLMEARSISQAAIREANIQRQIDDLKRASAAGTVVDDETGEVTDEDGGGADGGNTETPSIDENGSDTSSDKAEKDEGKAESPKTPAS